MIHRNTRPPFPILNRQHPLAKGLRYAQLDDAHPCNAVQTYSRLANYFYTNGAVGLYGTQLRNYSWLGAVRHFRGSSTPRNVIKTRHQLTAVQRTLACWSLRENVSPHFVSNPWFTDIQTGGNEAQNSFFDFDSYAYFQTEFTGGRGQWRTTNQVIDDNVLTFWAITFDGTSASNDPIIYKNAVPQALTETSTPSGTQYPVATIYGQSIWIGNTDANGDYYRGIDGIITLPLIWHRCLTQAEVEALYRDPWCLYWQPRRITYLPVDEGPPPQLVYPTSDVADGSWTPSTGTDLYPMVDEPTTPSDSDYIRSGASPVNDTAILQLGSVSTPDEGTTTLRVRAKTT